MLMTNRQKRRTTRGGTILALFAVCLPLCIIMAAFAIDMAWMQLARTELRTATDAAARAGVKELSLSQTRENARVRAIEAAARNKVAGQPLELSAADVEIGTSTRDGNSRFVFAEGGEMPNAIRVWGKRTEGSRGGPVDLLFAGMLGVTSFEPQYTATSSLLDRDICLVVDRSGSMMESAVGTSKEKKKMDSCNPPDSESRWVALDAGVNVFLDEFERSLQLEYVGMVSYASEYKACGIDYPETRIDSYLSPDLTAIRNAMQAIGSQPVQGRTFIGEGIMEGIKVLTGPNSRPFAVKTMILLTDGIQNGGTPAIVAAAKAVPEKITIHTITFSDEAEQEPMIEVAAATGGRHYHASNPEELIDVFKEIASTLPVLLTE